MRWLRIVMIALLLSASPSLAHAQDSSDLGVDWTTDGVLAVGALAGTFFMMLVPVDRDNRWDGELLGPIDERIKDNFSRNAAHISDGLVTTTVLAPLVVEAARGFDEAAGRRTLLYGETLATSLFANSVVKYIVQRPRPYVYHNDPSVMAYAAKQSDSQVSFYSGHASLSFSAATAGPILFSLSSDNEGAKAAMWASELALASATSVMRVRAGKHFTSDVVVGALAGSVIGFAVPALHTGEIYRPSGLEWGAIVGGIGLGTVVATLLPLGDEIAPLGDKLTLQSLKVAPMSTANGGGLSLSAKF
jgi:membrane-associated phospholipid phosphatase